MHTRTFVTTAAVCMIVLLPFAARGGGMEVREQGARALALSDSVTARLDHPSTVYFNPAGMGFLDGLQVSAGITLILPGFNYDDPDDLFPDASNTNAVVPPPHLYATWRINDMFAVGLSFNIPMGLGIEWPSDFAGRHIAQKSQMRVFLINPSAAIRPLENLSIGVGIQLVPATVEISRSFGFVTAGGGLEEGGVDIGGSGFGVGGNIGIQYRPVDWVYLGFFYRSRVQAHFEGGAHFNVPEGVDDRSIFHDQDVEADVTFPDVMNLGVGFLIADAVYIEASVDYVLWSTIQQLTIEFPDDASGQLTQPKYEEWRNGWTPRLGIDWKALETPQHVLFVRAGGGYDQVPAPEHTLSPLLPDAERVFFSAGLGYTYVPWRLTVDVGYMFSNFLARSVDESNCAGEGADRKCNPFPANYDSHANLLAIDVTWSVF